MELGGGGRASLSGLSLLSFRGGDRALSESFAPTWSVPTTAVLPSVVLLLVGVVVESSIPTDVGAAKTSG